MAVYTHCAPSLVIWLPIHEIKPWNVSRLKIEPLEISCYVVFICSWQILSEGWHQECVILVQVAHYFIIRLIQWSDWLVNFLHEKHNVLSALYRITGNFGEIFNLAIWWFCGKLPNLKSANIISYTIAISLYAQALAIAKFKICQCILMTDLPNLMLTKVFHYTVYGNLCYFWSSIAHT